MNVLTSPGRRAAFFAAWLLTLTGCGGGGGDAGGPGDGQSRVYQVSYEVGGTTASSMVSYRTPTASATGVPVSVPWTLRTEARQGDSLFLSAQNDGSLESVSVIIRVDGQVFRSDSRSGAFVVVTASGTCC